MSQDQDQHYRYTADSSRPEVVQKLQGFDALQRRGESAARMVIPARAPLEQLPTTLTLYDAKGTKKSNAELPMLYFAIGVTCEQIVQYAWRTDLPLEGPCKLGTVVHLAASHVVRRLTKLCRTHISWKLPSQGPFALVFSLYTNLDPPEERAQGQHERDVIATIQRELDTTEAPRWYFACEDEEVFENSEYYKLYLAEHEAEESDQS